MSFSDLVASKKLKDLGVKEKIRNRKIKYDFIENLIDDEFKKPNLYKYSETHKMYENNFVENYWNKIILCYECSEKIDGKLFETEEEIKTFSDGLLLKKPKEQVEYLIGIKKENINNYFKFDMSDSKKRKLLKKNTIIKFHTKDELLFINSSIELVSGINKESFDQISFHVGLDTMANNFTSKAKSIIDRLTKFSNLNEFSEFTKDKLFKRIFPQDKIKFEEWKKDREKNIFKIELSFIAEQKDGNVICYFNLININDEALKDRKNFETFRKDLKNIKGFEEAKKSNWISHTNDSEIKLDEKKEYLTFRNLLIKQLHNFQETYSDYKKNKFPSISIAYMARWGTGKTTIVRKLASDLSDLYNTVEINLWHISNSFDNGKTSNDKDSSFVRSIVKEALTQLSNSPDLVAKYIDSSKRLTEFSRENDVKQKMIDSLLQFPSLTNPETIFRERSKFLDQHISSLSRVTETIFNNTFKPTLFIFDDLDRIEDEKNVVKILDALVAFLSIPNAIYIIPVDEAKVMKAISSVKIGKDPYSFINKYFSYSIRAPFIPRLNAFKMLTETIEEMGLKELFIGKNEMLFESDILKKSSTVFPSTHRGMKDYLNAYQTNKFILEENKFVKNLQNNAKFNGKEIDTKFKNELIMLATILQIKMPLLSDYLSGDLNRKNKIFDSIKGKEGISDIRALLDYIKNDFSKDNKKEVDILNIHKRDLEVSDSEFWSSILNIEIPYNSYSSAQSLSNAIKKSIVNICENDGRKQDKLKALVVEKLIQIDKIFTNFDISKESNSSFKLLFWTLFTLAEINDTQAIEYAQQLDIFSLLSANDKDEMNDSINKKLSEENDIEEQISNLLDNVNGYLSKGFFDRVEYNKIINNVSLAKRLEIKFNIEEINVLDSIIENFVENFEKIENRTFFKNFSKETRKIIIKELIKSEWYYQVIRSVDNTDENSEVNAINSEFIKYTLEENSDILKEKIKLPVLENNEKINLEGDFNFEFLKNNFDSINFKNLIPRKLENFNKDFSNLLEFISKNKENIVGLDNVFNKIDINQYLNEKLLENEFQNEENLLEFIKNNQDFKNLEKFNKKTVNKIYDIEYKNGEKYFEKYFNEIFKNSKSVFSFEISSEESEIELFNKRNISIKYIESEAKLKKMKKIEFLKKYLDTFKLSEDSDKILEFIKTSIKENKKAEEGIVDTIIAFDDDNSLKKLFHSKYTFVKELSYEGELFWRNTPFSEILLEKCNISSDDEIKLSNEELLNKIGSLEDEESNLFYNSNPNSKVYTSLINIFKKLESEDQYRFYKMPKFDSASNDFKIEKEENNSELENKIKNDLSIKAVKELQKNKMPSFRKEMVDSLISDFKIMIEKLEEFGIKYYKESFKTLEKLVKEKQEKSESLSKIIEKWNPQNKPTKNLKKLNQYILVARKNQKYYEHKVSNIKLISRVLNHFKIVDNLENFEEDKNFIYTNSSIAHIDEKNESLESKLNKNLIKNIIINQYNDILSKYELINKKYKRHLVIDEIIKDDLELKNFIEKDLFLNKKIKEAIKIIEVENKKEQNYKKLKNKQKEADKTTKKVLDN